MDKGSFIIEGLGGNKTLRGTIRINGAKNAALKAMAAAVLFDGRVDLHNIPDTEDIHIMREILEKLGAKTVWHSGSLEINTDRLNSTTIDRGLAGLMRASVVLTGPLLGRFGKVVFPAPGGCVIGSRPIDQFIKGYEKMKAQISEDGGNYTIRFDDVGGPVGARERRDIRIIFEKKTVGGTETLMMASVLGNGTVTLDNCAREPEIVNVAEWLNSCGADISGIGTETMVVKGTGGRLLTCDVPYVAIPDRIEAGSYLLLGSLCAKEMRISNCRPDHMSSLIELVTRSGVPISIDTSNTVNGNSDIVITANSKPNSRFSAFDILTKEYPGFPTDLQAPVVVFLTQVTGTSQIVENIFEGRFKYISDLQGMGADILVKSPAEVVVNGPTPLHEFSVGRELSAHDIRAGFAMVMAALVAKGRFTINNTYFIDRGYERLEERLASIGAQMSRVQSR